MESRKLDQFYTNPKIAIMCLEYLSNHYSFDGFDFVLEPSAGSGAFYKLLPKSKRIGLDIDPKMNGIMKADFFDYEPRDGRYIVVGNPPFGKNSKTAVRFFNHAAKFSDVIAFILPNTFNKTSVRNRLNLNFHIIENISLPKNSFVFENKEYDVPCSFQIWAKSEIPRERIKMATQHPDFSFTTRENADFAIQRVGVAAGKVKEDFSSVANASHYFIKSNKKDAIETLRKIDWSPVKYNTAGNPSIAKTEIVELYEKNR